MAFFPSGQDARSTSSQIIRAIGAARSGAWVVGSGGGLDLYEEDSGQIKHLVPVNELDGCRPQSVLERLNDSVWIGCRDMLIRWDLNQGSIRSWKSSSEDNPALKGNIDALALDKADLLWLSSPGGGIQARARSGKIVHELRNLGNIEQLAVGPDGSMWYAGERGLHRWIPGARIFERVAGGPEELVFSFLVVPGGVWLHTLEGLERYAWNGNSLEVRDRVGFELGVPSVESGGVFLDLQGNVWATTSRGLVSFNPRKRQVRNFGIADGLPSHEFIGSPPLFTTNGLALASTSAGLVAFDPGALAIGPKAPAIDIDSISFRRGSGEINSIPPMAPQVELGPQDRDLRIAVRLKSLADASSRHFRIRLVGYDKTWVEDSKGERVFTQLEPGIYRLEAVAAVGSSDWSSPTSVRVIVYPAWWQTTSARASALILALLVGYFLLGALRARAERKNALALAGERQVLAEQASAAKSQFLADLGHEIRTPMTGVLGMAELLQSGPLEPQQRRRVEAIRAAGQHLLGLLNDALDLARIEAGRLELQDSPFDLYAVLEAVAELIRPQVESKGIEFRIVLEKSLPHGVKGDAGRLRQILLNLGHNAAKFTERGEVVLRAGDCDGKIRLEVSDTGIGLDASAKARLFARFEQAEGAKTWSEHGGSGLGLSICLQLVRAMQGRIDVESEPGRGTRFTVILPLREAEIPNRLVQTRLQVRENNGEPTRILLVEDDNLARQVISELLTRQGHSVELATHGLEAMAFAASRPFDLVLLDLDLPGLDGIELARIWPRHEQCAPIVALTARADSEAELRAYAVGMVGFLRKPVTGEMLEDAVARHARIGCAKSGIASVEESMAVG
jgi:signal transduction histidine kinase/CheY-like chemotaxis protein